MDTFNYRPPTKLQEGNVFSCVSVCLSTGESHVTTTHDDLDLTIQVLPPQPPAPLCTGTPRSAVLLVTSGHQDHRPVADI